MRIFKDVVCPVCKKDFPVGFNEKEQLERSKYSRCRNQQCRIMLWIPVVGDARIEKFNRLIPDKGNKWPHKD